MMKFLNRWWESLVGEKNIPIHAPRIKTKTGDRPAFENVVIDPPFTSVARLVFDFPSKNG
ncbi:MAG TPA: hypothetical protein VMM57_02085 [Bacteroidota bacterium]|nr:hypothetical protein [Bacteroidota bacterium]